MSLGTIILMRHAERLDRYMEAKGEDWISFAPRPQDPPLSPLGREQARLVATKLKQSGYPIRKILCSPLVRCVETADIVASELGLGARSLHVEPGLVEECKAMRGRIAPDPRPVWPLYLSATELQQTVSSRIDLTYTPVLQVRHVKNEAFYNQVQELADPPDHDDLNLDLDAVTRARCGKFVHGLLMGEAGRWQGNEGEDLGCVLCVGHGATVQGCAGTLQQGLAPEAWISGERGTSCFAAFCPCPLPDTTQTNHQQQQQQQQQGVAGGPWYAPKGVWSSGDAEDATASDNAGDMGR